MDHTIQTNYTYSIKTSNRFSVLRDLNGTTEPKGPLVNKHTDNTTIKPKPKYLQNELNILVINFQSLKNKVLEFRHMVSDEKPDVIIGTETWLHPNIKNTELNLDEYEIYRKDRQNNKKGVGVMIAVKGDLNSENINNKYESETIFCRIKLNSTPKKEIIVGSIYRPPNSDLETSVKICKELTSIKNQNKNAIFWVAGDFNLPNIDWDTVSSKTTNTIDTHFLDTIDILGWTQIIKFKTLKNNTLDLFFTDNPGLITKQQLLPGIGDHDAILIKSRLRPKRVKKTNHQILIWKKCNISCMREDIKEFSKSFTKKYTNNNNNVDKMWSDIKEVFKTVIDKHVPTKYTTRSFQQPWFNTETKRLARKKKRWFKKLRETNSDKVKERYRDIKKECQQACCKAHQSYLNTMFEDDKNNKKLWTYIKSKNKEQCGIPDLKANNQIIKTPKEKANILNSQFSSVFSNPQPQIDNHDTNKVFPKMNDIKVNKNGVLKLLVNIKEHKATGADEIPGMLLKLLATEIHEIYTILFQTSLDQGVLPSDWKKAKIMPLFKKGDKSNPENYRPISLTSISCKLLEHIIHSNIMDHLENNKILNNIQHGFRQKRSCESQLITTLNDFSNCLNNKGQIDSILLDFSKAFDKVDHRGLLLKLKTYGIQGKQLKWIESFLIGRTQTVIVDNHESNQNDVKSGVPQGTVLGPLLFLIYINDINENLSKDTKIRLFADDSFLYRNIKSQHDSSILQNDLDLLQKWERKWKMEFHPDKCQVLRITNKLKPVMANYQIHGKTLQETKHAKYLGVVIDSKLNWSEQNKTVCKKANNVLGFLKRNTAGCPKRVKETCYNTLVKPILNYGSSVWDPYQINQIQKLDKVQKNAARYITNNYSFNSGSTDTNFKELGWISLSEQRAKSKVTTLYKGINNLLEIPLDQFRPNENKRPTRQSGYQMLKIPQSKVDSHLYSFFPNTIRLWNSLPECTKLINNIDTFINS